ncbi:phage baseplate assembly protein V [Undibacterium arcticum]|uniref:Phage baseplate assembly protein V n=1 Tax=Undibacterium arcticum TaxID=1762892 RepID=A0ABV7FCD7_9BURK
MREMLNAMRMQAVQAMGERASTRLGTVQSYDPGNYAVRVALQPEGNLTGWIPLLSPWVGNGWGMFCPPTIGDLVEVQFQEADHDAPMSCMRFYNDKNRPLSVPSGEFWLVHKSGAFFKLLNNGSGTFSDGHGATVTLNGDGTISSAATQWNHTGPQHITGNVVITGTQQVTGQITGQGGMAISGGSGATVAGNMAITGGNVTADGIGLKTHTHTDPQGGTVGAPQ